jgi:hypothetical protein
VNIVFALDGDDVVEAASVDIIDFEGGIAGQPVSVAIFRGETDFVFRNAADLFVLDTLSATMDDIGQLKGEPIGPIIQIDLQASNENQDIPGAFFDNLTAIIAGGCIADFNGDGMLNILDFVAFQTAFVKGDPGADVNGDGVLNILDFVAFQQLFQAGCP